MTTEKNPNTNGIPDVNTTASFSDNSSTYQVYDTGTGIIHIPNNDNYPANSNGGNGLPTSQPYTLNLFCRN